MPDWARRAKLMRGPDEGDTLSMNVHDLDLQLKFDSSHSLLEMLREGVPRELLVSTAELLDMTPRELCSYLPVSWRTLRRRGGDQPLPMRVGDHLLQINVVVRRAAAVMGDYHAAVRWLKSSVLALGGETPISLLGTCCGIRVVLDTIGRIEHGVHS